MVSQLGGASKMADRQGGPGSWDEVLGTGLSRSLWALHYGEAQFQEEETEAARILECLCSQLQNSLFSTFYWAQLSFKEKTLKVHFSFFRNKTKTDLPYLCVCVHRVCAGVCRSLRVSVGFPGTGVTSSCDTNVLGKCSKSLSWISSL